MTLSQLPSDGQSHEGRSSDRQHFDHQIVRYRNGEAIEVVDQIAIESPMQTNVIWSKRGRQIDRPVTVTMRTPGHDKDLAIGFLIAEGVIKDLNDVERIDCKDNQTDVHFRPGIVVELCDLHRRGTTTSACGVCGKTTIEQIRVKSHVPLDKSKPVVDASLLMTLPDELRKVQNVFAKTGGLHGCGLFTIEGQLLSSAEDVGRHNALDKLIGLLCRTNPGSFRHSVLVLSGRISFELVQKSLVVGIPVVVAVGAPSSLAIETAEAFDQTLIGFTRPQGMSIYSGSNRVRSSQ